MCKALVAGPLKKIFFASLPNTLMLLFSFFTSLLFREHLYLIVHKGQYGDAIMGIQKKYLLFLHSKPIYCPSLKFCSIYTCMQRKGPKTQKVYCNNTITQSQSVYSIYQTIKGKNISISYSFRNALNT